MTDQNIDGLRSTPAQLKNMLEKDICMKKNSKLFIQQISQTLPFQMRYDSLPYSEEQPSDSLTG